MNNNRKENIMLGLMLALMTLLVAPLAVGLVVAFIALFGWWSIAIVAFFLSSWYIYYRLLEREDKKRDELFM